MALDNEKGREAGKALVEMTDRRIKNAFTTAPFDRTTWGIVSDIDTNGGFVVTINKVKYTGIKPLKGSGNIKRGDKVTVAIPNGEMSNSYIIGVIKEKSDKDSSGGGGGGTIEVDSSLSLTSDNPVENKVITAALNGKANVNGTYPNMTAGDSQKLGGLPSSDYELNRYAIVGQNANTTANSWYMVAEITLNGANQDRRISFHAFSTYSDTLTAMGVLTAHIRTGGTAGGVWSSSELVWEYGANGIAASNFVLTHTTTAHCVAQIWVNIPVGYRRFIFKEICESSINGVLQSDWTLYNTQGTGLAEIPAASGAKQTSTFATFNNSTALANVSWNTIRWDRLRVGESVVVGSLVALSTDGLAYKLTTGKPCALPLTFGRIMQSYTSASTYASIYLSMRGVNISELTTTAINGFTLTPSTLVNGMPMYLRGSIDGNGYFVCDGNIAQEMTAGYTWVYMGECDNATTATTALYTINAFNGNAYTLDSNGTIVKINGKTNGTTEVLQHYTTQNGDFFPLLSNTTTNGDTIARTQKSDKFKANPSTGEFYAYGYRRINITGQTLDINTLNLSSGSPTIQRYRCATNGGSANITNIPVAGYPFILDVELIRWASTTDYITLQTFISVYEKNNRYIRYCTSGTWDTAWTMTVGDRKVQTLRTKTHLNYSADQYLIPDSGSLAYWNGAYAANNNSNLTYSVNGTIMGTKQIAFCTTAAATAAKEVTTINDFALYSGCMISVYFQYANTAASALTLNIKSTGAKTIYINGVVSSASNNTLQAGWHTFYYNGTNWYTGNSMPIPGTKAYETFNTIYSNRFCVGEAVTNGSLCALSTDGKMWKLSSGKECVLPLIFGRAQGTYVANATGAYFDFQRRGVAKSELTDTTKNTLALPSAWNKGMHLYLRGSININGNFIPDGTITSSMTGGTYVYMGNVDYESATTTNWTLEAQNGNALTVVQGGGVTAINGQIVKGDGRLTTPREFDGILFDGTSNVIRFAWCNTNATTTNKTITIPNMVTVTTGNIIKPTDGFDFYVMFANAFKSENSTLSIDTSLFGGSTIKLTALDLPYKNDNNRYYLANKIYHFLYSTKETTNGKLYLLNDAQDAHPVGSYYISNTNTSPAQLFGGSWTPVVAGATLRTKVGSESTTNNTLITGTVPNINGAVSFRRAGYEGTQYTAMTNNSGAFDISNDVGNFDSIQVSGAYTYNPQQLNFNASDGSVKSNVYTDTTTYGVVPDHVAVYMWYRTA